MAERLPYPSDLTEVQWRRIQHLFPPEHRPRGQAGRYRRYRVREIVNAVFYRARSGCAWRMLPHDLPPWKTVSYYFYTWQDQGVWERMHRIVRVDVLKLADRGQVPSAGVVGSQPDPTT